jgi:excinuclease ABC subunit A
VGSPTHKASRELSKRYRQHFYILDEPLQGILKIYVLMGVINTLVDKGNTILIIEHNMDVIKLADYIIDIGPEGGKGGGKVVKGTPEEIADNKKATLQSS